MCTITSKQINQIQALILKAPHPKTLNQLLKLLANSDTPQNAFLLYNQMLHHPTCHNNYTFSHALKACFVSHSHQKGLEIHARVVKSGHLSDIFIQNSLIHFYVTQNEICSARRIFNSISAPDVVSLTSIISGLSKCGYEEEALLIFSKMNVKPNLATLVGVVSACSGLGDLGLGKSVHGYSLRSLDVNGILLDNALLDFYMKCGDFLSAEYLFVYMLKRDVVSWTTMVGGYARRGFCEEAVRIFKNMVQEGEAEPNEATLVNVLSACSSVSGLSLGRWVHSYIYSRPDLLAYSNNVGNALLNMYLKCGDVDMAIQVFNTLIHKDIISWSTIIRGLLSAGSHAGLVGQGLMFFKAMESVYGVVPQMQHYACMVDMYGRAGRLEEAEAFIRTMPLQADGPVWGALLNACRIHGDDEMFKRIRVGLLNSRGVSIGTFALLSNTYASSDRWDDANEVRDAMRSMGLKKMAGRSWIETVPANSGQDFDACLAEAAK
ncbi:pentatricopeptide repeat-containing protein At4g38010-like isoform X2 [Tripterygium wilfordii]|uniref:pentatricopeptide repeat-containing protein At4g38010-like isoform X2 n=1 Tax=Tripterygium wilfordii TaxID=458696 RepID=UPI0018F84CBB|nr:pentatricopeptide repeat-containing protein At4g38010-like isoform X2 [Tripterygium wilfordii]